MKIERFKLGKRNQYKGIAIHIYKLKFELIKFGKKRLYRIEWNGWNE